MKVEKAVWRAGCGVGFVLSITLPQSSNATELTVHTVGEPLVVYIDGVETGTTPLGGRDLAAGEHTISAKDKQSSVKRLDVEVEVSGLGRAFVEFDWRGNTARAFLTEDAATGKGSSTPSLALVQLQQPGTAIRVFLLPSEQEPIELKSIPTLAPVGAHRCLVQNSLGELEWPLVLRAGSYELLDVQDWLPSQVALTKVPAESSLELRSDDQVVWSGEGSGFATDLDTVVGIKSTGAVIPNLPAGSYKLTVNSGLLGDWQDSILLEPGLELEHSLDWRVAENYDALAEAYAAHRALARDSGLNQAKTRAVLSTVGTGIAVGASALLALRGSSFTREAADLSDRYDQQLQNDEIADAIDSYEQIAAAQRSARWSWVGAGAMAVPAGFGVSISFKGWRQVQHAAPSVPEWDPYGVVSGVDAPSHKENE